MAGTLYLLPCGLGEDSPTRHLPAATLDKLLSLHHFVVEEARSARRFLASIGRSGLREVTMAELNEHTPAEAIPALLAPLKQGLDLGLLSEAGCPAVADPGAELVARAHLEGLRVVPMVGPSSILLALMASGLGGQRFAFHGYLPVEPSARRAALVELERQSAVSAATQIFIETPYRNTKLLQDVLAVCKPATRLCLATDLTLATEFIATRAVQAWRRDALPELNRRPTVFALSAASDS